jgi:hypothetical protein
MNPIHAHLVKTYLEYFNNFLTVEKFAAVYDIEETLAHSMIDKGRELYDFYSEYPSMKEALKNLGTGL